MKQLQTSLPNYLVAHTKEKIEEINSIKNNHASFMFSTDFHTLYNSMYSPLISKEIAFSTNCKHLFNGGDFPFAFGTNESCIEDTLLALESLAMVKPEAELYVLRGNHDTTIRRSWEEDTGITLGYDQTRDLIFSQNSPGAILHKDKMYYYVDDTSARVRYICIDTADGPLEAGDKAWGTHMGCTDEQLNWLCDTLNVAEGWLVVVLGHVSVEKEIRCIDEPLFKVGDVLKAYKNKRAYENFDFSNYKGDLVAYICGHHHVDEAIAIDNTLFVLTGCDSMFPDDIWERTEGTISEVLFDTFVIDKESKTLYAIRTGAGESRTFKY